VSYYPPMGPPPPAPSSSSGVGRPQIVTAAAGLMLMLALLDFITVGLGIAYYAQEGSSTAAAGNSGANGFSSIGGGVVATGLLIVMAMMVLRGKNWARIVTFVIAGLGIACCGCGSVFIFGGGAFLSYLSSTSSSDVASQISFPAWYFWGVGTLYVLAFLCSVAIVVLLAMRPSNEWFKAMAPQARPPYQPPYPPQQPPYGGPPQQGGNYPQYPPY